MNKVVLITIIVLSFYILTNLIKSKENFNLGLGKSFGWYHKPQNCRIENDCIKGSYYRNYEFNNVCEPCHGLLRQPKSINSSCVKKL